MHLGEVSSKISLLGHRLTVLEKHMRLALVPLLLAATLVLYAVYRRVVKSELSLG